MARGSQEKELEFIKTAADSTGRSVPEWMELIANAQLPPKSQTILNYLKKEQGLNHMQANYLSGLFLNDGEPVFNYENLYKNLFAGKMADWKQLVDALEQRVTAQFDDVVFVPTKNYISIEGEKIFGCAKLTSKAVRYGLDLGERPFVGRVQKAKGLGAMPNITHMVELDSQDDLDDELDKLTQEAFDRVHR